MLVVVLVHGSAGGSAGGAGAGSAGRADSSAEVVVMRARVCLFMFRFAPHGSFVFHLEAVKDSLV